MAGAERVESIWGWVSCPRAILEGFDVGELKDRCGQPLAPSLFQVEGSRKNIQTPK